MLLVIAPAAILATLCGGVLALHYHDRLHLVLGFSAGAVIGVTFFDLLPEALELAGKSYDHGTVLTLTAIGFSAYLLLDRLGSLHAHADSEQRVRVRRGIAGAGSLSVHSLLDGIAIGLAFQASPSVGIIVAAAVLVHDLSDGINTVGLVLKNGGSRALAIKWLVVDALAPALGIIATAFFSVPESELGLALAVFSGFFLYIGASDLVPESHQAHPRTVTTLMTILGLIVIFVATRVAAL